MQVAAALHVDEAGSTSDSTEEVEELVKSAEVVKVDDDQQKQQLLKQQQRVPLSPFTPPPDNSAPAEPSPEDYDDGCEGHRKEKCASPAAVADEPLSYVDRDNPSVVGSEEKEVQNRSWSDLSEEPIGEEDVVGILMRAKDELQRRVRHVQRAPKDQPGQHALAQSRELVLQLLGACTGQPDETWAKASDNGLVRILDVVIRD